MVEGLVITPEAPFAVRGELPEHKIELTSTPTHYYINVIRKGVRINYSSYTRVIDWGTPYSDSQENVWKFLKEFLRSESIPYNDK